MAFADDLLEQAKHLAKRESKRPRQASLRRAVSTAYCTVAHLRNVASAFGQLYEDRQIADYDNGTQWSRVEVLTEIDLVEQAFGSWQAIRNQDIANDYLLSLIARGRQ